MVSQFANRTTWGALPSRFDETKTLKGSVGSDAAAVVVMSTVAAAGLTRALPPTPGPVGRAAGAARGAARGAWLRGCRPEACAGGRPRMMWPRATPSRLAAAAGRGATAAAIVPASSAAAIARLLRRQLGESSVETMPSLSRRLTLAGRPSGHKPGSLVRADLHHQAGG